MPEQPKKFYVTTPIYYVNARPHIGHAYTTIVADVLARRHRLLGDDTFFLTGTDEHGQKIERSAAAAGVPPQQFADEVSASFAALWKRMGITNDKFIRTTDPKHAAGVQKLFSELYARGFIELRNYTGSYCVSDETFVDAPAGTPCPDCGRLLETVTEENFFFKLSEFQRPLLDLIESGALKVEPESRKNEVLSFLRGNVAAAVDTTPDTGIQPDAKYGSDPSSNTNNSVILSEAQSAESKDPDDAITATTAGPFSTTSAPATRAYSDLGHAYVPGALKDLSISRSSFTWGIPVPEPAASAASQKHVIYVWLDALANYMTAIGYGSDAPADEAEFKKFWPADLHLVGKEIIRFHCVYWPAFLLAAGLPLPRAITAHGWLLFDNSKMSKSKGNIVRTETILDAFGTLCPPTITTPRPTPNAVILSGARSAESKDPEEAGTTPTFQAISAPTSTQPTKAERDLFAADVLRYFLLREIPFGQDGSFSFDALITRYNADLANGYGNLVSRTLKLVETGLGGTFSAIHNMGFAVGIGTTLDESIAAGRYSWTLGVDSGVGAPDPLWNASPSLEQAVRAYLQSRNFSQATELIAQAIQQIDGFLSESEPWKIAKETSPNDPERLNAILYTAAESIRIITALLYPILPYATARVWAQLGLGDIELAARNGELTNLQWGGLKPGTKLGPLSPIFPRADKGLAQIMTDMENPDSQPENSQLETGRNPTRPAAPLKQALTPTPAEPIPASTFDPAAPPRTSSLDSLAEPSGTLSVGGSDATTTRTGATPSHTEMTPSGPLASVASQTPMNAAATDASPQITIDDFAKIELRVAQIIVAERIPKADKLLRLEVDLGPDMPKRQILSGIAEHYTPEDLIGRRIIVITNLAPRKMRGLESHGMLLAASHGENGKPVLATMAEDIALGSRLK